MGLRAGDLPAVALPWRNRAAKPCLGFFQEKAKP